MISIILPTYNREKSIARAINSVVNQDSDNWRLIIIDDGSIDDTPNVVNEYSGDTRIYYHKLEKNMGNAYSRNIGVSFANSDWVSFLDSDDELHPDFVKETLKHIKNTRSDFFWTGVIWKKDGKELSRGCWQPDHGDRLLFFRELKIGTGCGLTIRREIFNSHSFDPQLRSAVDTDFLLRISQNYTFSVLPLHLVYLNITQSSVRSKSDQTYQSYKKMLSKHQNIILDNPDIKLRWYKKLIRLAIENGKIRDSINYLKMVWPTHPQALTYFCYNILKYRIGI
jgi:glycosyltransferase involved in cell wall biosynthesis